MQEGPSGRGSGTAFRGPSKGALIRGPCADPGTGTGCLGHSATARSLGVCSLRGLIRCWFSLSLRTISSFYF